MFKGYPHRPPTFLDYLFMFLVSNLVLQLLVGVFIGFYAGIQTGMGNPVTEALLFEWDCTRHSIW